MINQMFLSLYDIEFKTQSRQKTHKKLEKDHNLVFQKNRQKMYIYINPR